ncbi:MAG: ZIP family metal transporter [Pirellulales bacterium]
MLLLVVYSLICVVASLAGGWVPLVMRLTHRGMQLAISFVSGIVLGIGLLHLLPHSFEALGSIHSTVLWVLAGFLFMFFLERFFHFHHHDAPGEELAIDEGDARDAHTPHEHAGDRDRGHSHAGLGFSWVGVAIGLALHGLVDGVTLAAAVMAEQADPAAVLAGIGACLAVALHKPFDSLTIGTLMAAAGRSVASRSWINALYSLVTPLGVVLFYVLSGGASDAHSGLGQTLGFAAGTFLCIATSDLLPELQFHRHDRVKLSAALAAGLALAWSAVFLETGGHDHVHAPQDASHADEHDHPH